ncbi:MAG: dienelactone hydrolase family protein [Vicinamibacteria bacterium]|jgi:hypothetical protein
MSRTARAALLALLVLVAPAVALAASYARTVTLDVDGSSVTIDVYEPVARPIGVAIVAHGWTRSRARHRDAGRALAEAGVVAIVPDLPNYLDLWGNGTAIMALVGRLEAGALGLAPVERSSMVLIGTSAGGLATVWAASKLPGIAGWVGLDPVDRTGTGMYAASKLAAPAIVLLGDASACNLFSSGKTLANSVPRLVRSVKIDGASHCDFEAPTNGFCSVMCGVGSREKQLEAQSATVLAALELLAMAHAAHAPVVQAPSAPPVEPPGEPEVALPPQD